jgi:myo-inositol-1(or 4)-monophosphatase
MNMKKSSESINLIDLNQARTFLINEVIPVASALLRNYFNTASFTSRQKEGVDFTTQADEETDNLLVERIREEFPQSEFLTEETAPSDHAGFESKENLWIIDPLDGTTNFSRKNPNFAISIALVNKGVIRLAVIHRPITNETFTAQIDKKGAFLNGETIRVSKTTDLRKVVMACDWAWDLEKRKMIVNLLTKLTPKVRQIKAMGSAASDLASLANGNIDVYVHSGLKPWDVAAASLVVTKAGGKITTLSGEKWNVFIPEILVTNGLLHEQIKKLIVTRYTQK